MFSRHRFPVPDFLRLVDRPVRFFLVGAGAHPAEGVNRQVDRAPIYQPESGHRPAVELNPPGILVLAQAENPARGREESLRVPLGRDRLGYDQVKRPGQGKQFGQEAVVGNPRENPRRIKGQVDYQAFKPDRSAEFRKGIHNNFGFFHKSGMLFIVQ